jgi:hypothetical protein
MYSQVLWLVHGCTLGYITEIGKSRGIILYLDSGQEQTGELEGEEVNRTAFKMARDCLDMDMSNFTVPWFSGTAIFFEDEPGVQGTHATMEALRSYYDHCKSKT